MKIELHLRHHCLQTAARLRYEDILRQYLKPHAEDGDPELLEDEIEGLKFLLEACDFPHMRSRYPELSGREETRIVLEMPGEKKEMVIRCGKKKIRPRWKRVKR